MSQIYITGDTHGDPIQRLSSKNFPDGKTLTTDDHVIVAGDFGVIWNNKPSDQEDYILKWLSEKPWTTLFIDGNHENHARLAKLPIENKWGGRVGVVNEKVYHLKRGELYDIGGKTLFCFGGAYSWDRYHRLRDISYWEEEVPNHAEMDYGLQQLESKKYCVDYIVTHTLPMTLIPILGFDKSPSGKEDPTTKYLDYIANVANFKKWYFGHMHVNKDLGRFKAIYHDIEQII